ncbi:MAG: two component transcriptional regulator, LuxR family [Solirubrobacterales bacterium]|nr:two component transcriptional regulator, LuxR family [Solirubrobacterales bacterium]
MLLSAYMDVTVVARARELGANACPSKAASRREICSEAQGGPRHRVTETVYRAVASGAGASMESSRERICDAIAAVARGEVVLSAEVQAGLASEIQMRERDERPALTPREHEVLALTADGHSAPDIGRQLHLSQSTVKTHLKSLYEKLAVNDRAAAVAEAMRRGLLE